MDADTGKRRGTRCASKESRRVLKSRAVLVSSGWSIQRRYLQISQDWHLIQSIALERHPFSSSSPRPYVDRLMVESHSFKEVSLMKFFRSNCLGFAWLCVSVGCGSAQTTASTEVVVSKAASPAPSAAKAASRKETNSAVETDKASAGSESVPESSAQEEGLRKASRPPAELITNPTVLYVFNFGESDTGKSAKERCEASGEGKSRVAECMAKAREKVPVESIRFVKKGAEYFWITLNRYRGNLLKWHVIPFKVGEEGTDRVVIKPFGKDKGIAPMPKLPSALEITLPNDYSIVVKDPEFGNMTFDAKIGAIED